MRLRIAVLGTEVLAVELGRDDPDAGPTGLSVEGADVEVTDEVPFGFTATEPVRETTVVPQQPRPDYC